MKEGGREPGSTAVFLAAQWVTRMLSDFPSRLPAARERSDQMVFYHNRWEQKNKYISMNFSLINMLLEE